MSDNKIDMYTEDLPDGTAKRAADLLTIHQLYLRRNTRNFSWNVLKKIMGM